MAANANLFTTGDWNSRAQLLGISLRFRKGGKDLESIGHTHPGWPQVVYLSRPETVAQAHLSVAPLDHGIS